MNKIKKIIWKPYIKGLRTEIVKWGYADTNSKYLNFETNPMWNAYILIKKKNLPYTFKKLVLKPYKSKFDGRYCYDDYKLADYFDMHYGITFYEVLKNEIGDIFAIKVGCDYGHYGEEGVRYNFENVLFDLKNSVNCFIKHFPNYKVWCQGNGKYYKPTKANGILKELEAFKSYEYFKKLKKEIK